MKNNFSHLHSHSDYSLLDGMCKPIKLFTKAKELGMGAVAITDHGNCDVFVKALKASKEVGINYIPGSELYMVDSYNDLTKQTKFTHLNIFARNRKGLSEIFKILGTANEHFYRKPIVSFKDLRNFNFKHLILSTACSIGIMGKDDYKDKMKFLVNKVTDNVFTEVMPHDFTEQPEVNRRAIVMARRYDCKVLATNDCHYIDSDDYDTHDVMLAINTNRKVLDINRYKFSIDTLYFCDKKQFIDLFHKQGKLSDNQILRYIDNTNLLVDQIDFESFKKFDIHINLDNYSLKMFIDLVKKRFKNMQFYSKTIYKERLEQELKLVIDKGFDKYFYIVYDFVKYAKSKGIMIGPGRGSVGGSLLSYVLGITQVDPIKYSLSFSRFLAPDRVDAPDIDLDIEDTRRSEVLDYLKDKYGDDAVVNISTFIEMKPRAVLRDVSRVLEIPSYEVEIASKVIDDSQPKTLEFYEEEIPEITNFLGKYSNYKDHFFKLQLITKAAGVHAAGCVIENEKINDSGRGYIVKRKDKEVLNWDKDDAEFMGFIKFDILGLSTLTVISNTLKYIKEKGKKVSLKNIKLDDEKVLEIFRIADTTGVFQFNSFGMRKLLKSAPIENFNDLVNLNALFRPGPLHGGLADKYIAIKKGEEEPYYYDSRMYEKVTKNTYGLIIYQEQLLNILTGVGFEYTEADIVRRLCSKSKGIEEIKKYKKKFIKLAIKNTILDKAKAEEIFGQLVYFGGYGFNLSHATSYSLIGYWTAFLKCYYFEEFMQACMTYAPQIKLQEYIDDAVEHGYELSKIDINKSMAITWRVENKKVYLPFMSILGIGDKAAYEIERVRNVLGKVSNSSQFAGMVNSRACNKRVIELLEKAGAFSEDNDYDKDIYKIKLSSGSDIIFNIYEKKFNCFDFSDKLDYIFVKYINEDGIACHSISKNSLLQLKVNNKELYSRFHKGEHIFAYIKHGKLLKGANLNDIVSCNFNDIFRDTDINVIRGLSYKQLTKLGKLDQEIKKCNACLLSKECKKVTCDEYSTNVVILGEAPGVQEELQGKPFVGDAGILLFDKIFKNADISRDKFSIMNLCKHYPVVSRTPDETHIQICTERWLDKQLKIIKPILILSLGRLPASFLQSQKVSITKISGQTVYNERYQCWICYSVHPSYVLHQHTEEAKKLFVDSIYNFIEKIEGLSGI